MELKSRQTYIFRTLLERKQKVDMEEFLDKLGVGKRTLYYDIEKCNDWLKQYGLGKVMITWHTVYAEIPVIPALEQKFRQDSNYFFSVPERRAMEIVQIGLSDEPITINRLMELSGVSKNTILGDIKEIRQTLKSWGLTLRSTIQYGYLIQGEEMTIRKMLGAQFQLLSSPGGQSYVHNFLQKSLVGLYRNDIDFSELCRCLIKQYETDIHGDYLLTDIELIQLMIEASLLRSRKGSVVQLSSEEQLALMKSLSFRSVEFSLQKLRIHEVEVAAQETYFITTLFLGIQTTDFLSQELEDSFIEGFAEEMVINFERVACLSLPNRQRLQKQLSHHIRPMYYRIKYGIQEKNPLIEDIKAMYPSVFDFTRKTVQMTKMSFLADEISEDELAYLCVYFVSNLNEKYISGGENTGKGKVLIVGPENMAVAALLREQLQDLFGLSLDYRVISQSKLRQWMLNDYVLVVSLVPLSKDFSSSKVVECGAIITEKEQRSIMQILRADQFIVRYDEMIQEIISRVKNSVSGKIQTDKLYLDLLRYFEDRDRGEQPKAQRDIFYEKIERNNFITLPESADLEQALKLCSKFLAPKTNDQRLMHRMMNLLQSRKLQTYPIARNVELIHFPMQGDTAPKIDVCIALAPGGVFFPDEGRANILIGLATKDSYSHWSVLEEIYRYFSDQNHVDGIMQLCQNRKEGSWNEKNSRAGRSRRERTGKGVYPDQAESHPA